MYYDFFGFREPPFSIAPDPRYLYLSERHKEALAHLMYGVQGQGGFIVITGEVGTGKTTVSRCFIENVPEHVDIALILNPRLSARELLSSVCDELEIEHDARASIKQLVSLINKDLLEAHAAGRHKVLMIDEAQNLSADVLEQLRLLTNLETAEKKLLQIVLLGQPELHDMLRLPQLRQLNQRVTARYHLEGLARSEIEAYVRYRLSVAGLRGEIFTETALRALYRYSEGIPRLMNLIGDRALLGAYAQSEHQITAAHVRNAASEVNGKLPAGSSNLFSRLPRWAPVAGSAVLAIMLTLMLFRTDNTVDAADADSVPLVSNEQFVGSVERVEEEPAQESESQLADFEFGNRFNSLADAFRALFAIWDLSYQASESPLACDFADQEGLGCIENRSSRQGLVFINRPAILHLKTNDGQAGYVVLESLESDRAIIRTPKGRNVVSFTSLETFWHGQYTVLWQRPPFAADPGDEVTDDLADKQIWMSAQLMELASQKAQNRTEESQVMRMNSEEQVRWYQSKKGLAVDGIAGAKTIIQIHNDLDADVPRLDRQREVQ